MSQILVINGHPNPESFNYALHNAFKNGVHSLGVHQIDEIRITEISFNPSLNMGYDEHQVLEQGILEAREKIRRADHIVWVFPLWWGMMPAILKGFIDRVFTPGFAFKYHEKGGKWDKLLKGKTTEIICTTDYPVLILKYMYGEGGVKVMRKMVFDFCGLKTFKTTFIGPVRTSDLQQRKKWLKEIEELGRIRAHQLAK